MKTRITKRRGITRKKPHPAPDWAFITPVEGVREELRAKYVYVHEAWYICPVHGDQHHPTGPNVDEPCSQCSTSAVKK